MTTSDQSTPTVDQAGGTPAAPADPAAPSGDAAPAAAPTLVPVQPGLLVRFTRQRKIGEDEIVTAIVLTVEDGRAKVAELGAQWDVPANALRPISSSG